MSTKGFLKNPLVIFIVIWGLLNVIIYLAVPVDDANFENYTSIVYDSAVLISALVLFYVFAFYKFKSFEGKFWLLMGIGMFLWFIAEVIWYYYISINENPFPSIADFFFLLAYIPIYAGIVYKSKFSKMKFDARKIAAMIISVLLFLIPAYIWVIQPIIDDGTYGFTEKAISVAYPVLDIILLAFAVIIALYWGSTVSKGWYIISLSFMIMTIADTLFAAMEWQENYDPRWELLWVASYLLFAIGALYQKKYHESFL